MKKQKGVLFMKHCSWIVCWQ